MSSSPARSDDSDATQPAMDVDYEPAKLAPPRRRRPVRYEPTEPVDVKVPVQYALRYEPTEPVLPDGTTRRRLRYEPTEIILSLHSLPAEIIERVLLFSGPRDVSVRYPPRCYMRLGVTPLFTEVLSNLPFRVQPGLRVARPVPLARALSQAPVRRLAEGGHDAERRWEIRFPSGVRHAQGSSRGERHTMAVGGAAANIRRARCRIGHRRRRRAGPREYVRGLLSCHRDRRPGGTKRAQTRGCGRRGRRLANPLGEPALARPPPAEDASPR